MRDDKLTGKKMKTRQEKKNHKNKLNQTTEDLIEKQHQKKTKNINISTTAKYSYTRRNIKERTRKKLILA